MQVVIEISDYDKEWVTNGYCIPDEINGRIAEAIINGTPLPKHHGRLIDYDDLIEKLDRYGRGNVKYQLPYSPTIIEADRAESEDKTN